MRIAIDAMGGDHAPHQIVKGAVASLDLLGDDELLLVGDTNSIEAELAEVSNWNNKISIVHTTQVVSMDDSPVEALRNKRDSSIAVMAKLASSKQVDAVISAGNTGALVAACQMKIKPLPGVVRPGIAVTFPGFHGPCILCDCGANPECRPINLHQYAVMSSLYAKEVWQVETPRVGLLSIGEEDAKGNKLVKEARARMKSDPTLNFRGNVEGRDIFSGEFDVVVADGFVGNVVLKLVEGLAETFYKNIGRSLLELKPEMAMQMEATLGEIYNQHDYNEHGGAPLLGVDGVCIICHGSSDYRSIKNSVKLVQTLSQHHVNQQITEYLSELSAAPAIPSEGS